MTHITNSPELNAFLAIVPPEKRKVGAAGISRYDKKTIVTVDGITQSIAAHLKARGIGTRTFNNRIYLGWPIEKALRPLRNRNNDTANRRRPIYRSQENGR